MPTFLLHHIDGIEERGPGGNDRRWDNKARPVLPINGVSWNYEVVAPAPPPPAVEPAPVAPPKKLGSNRGIWVMWTVMMAIAVGIGWLFKKAGDTMNWKRGSRPPSGLIDVPEDTVLARGSNVGNTCHF